MAGRKEPGRTEIGRDGESIAARFLERLGYEIRERNFRSPHGEIDLIAAKDGYLVFVEVKTRTARSPYHPVEAVTEAKRRQVRQLGEYYCAEHPQAELQPRFDVVAVRLGRKRADGRTEEVEHFINAF